MTIYTCEKNWQAMLSCIYDAWSSGQGHDNIRLEFATAEQYSLFDNYIYVEADELKATKVMDAINQKLNSYVYRQLYITSLSDEDDVLENIYHTMILAFAIGPTALDMVKYKDIFRNIELRRRVEKEANRFQEIIRFHKIGEAYVAHIDARCRVLEFLGPIFHDRMPSEHFIIVDDTHKEAVVHPKDGQYYLWKLNDAEFNKLCETEDENDEYTDMWKAFYETIGIRERENRRCQMGHFPLWARKHAVEFADKTRIC